MRNAFLATSWNKKNIYIDCWCYIDIGGLFLFIYYLFYLFMVLVFVSVNYNNHDAK